MVAREPLDGVARPALRVGRGLHPAGGPLLPVRGAPRRRVGEAPAGSASCVGRDRSVRTAASDTEQHAEELFDPAMAIRQAPEERIEVMIACASDGLELSRLPR